MDTLEDYASRAVNAALKQDWNTAIDLNLKILEHESNNIPALNRLGRAYGETGQDKLAKKIFKKVLDLDKHNSVASNALARLKLGLKTSGLVDSSFSFIEEPGKTKTVALYKLAPHTTLAELSPGMPVVLKPSQRQIRIQSPKRTFIGYLPDDLAIHLVKLIKLGNKYEAAIKTVEKNKAEIFIRETKRATRLKGVPSFSIKDANRHYQFLPTEPISESPLEIQTTEEDESA